MMTIYQFVVVNLNNKRKYYSTRTMDFSKPNKKKRILCCSIRDDDDDENIIFNVCAHNQPDFNNNNNTDNAKYVIDDELDFVKMF